jgi:predicted phosphoribosyltransferase
MIFQNRSDAGRQLSKRLVHYADHDDVLVLALPRGGVPVGHEVAEALGAPLDVFIVRKLGLPGHEELAMGAIASGDVRVLNERVLHMYPVPDETIDHVEAEERQELARREYEYRGGRPPLSVYGKTVVLVDDGLATGSTMRAAVAALRRLGPAKIVVAVPVGAADTCAEFEHEADEVVCASEPEPFYGVGQWYEDFSQTTDQDVRDLLDHRDHAKAE